MTTSVDFRGLTITRDDIRRALAGYDRDYPYTNDYRGWLDKRNYRFALVEKGRLYPPKYILSRATCIPLEDLYGGDGPGGANTVLGKGKLEFEVILKQEAQRRYPANQVK